MKKKFKIAILTTHVIQYQGPLFKKLATHPQIDLTVLFCSKKGVEEYKDGEFGVDIKWDRNLLNGYRYKFLTNYSPLKNHTNYFQYMNFGVLNELMQNKYDAVIMLGYGWFTSWLAWAIAIWRKIPIIFRGEANLLNFNKKNKFRRYLSKKALKAFFSKCIVFLPIGKLNHDFYRYFDIATTKMFFCPYAVDNVFFMGCRIYEKEKKDEIKDYYRIPIDKIIILFAGKFLRKKRPMDLLEAGRKLKNMKDCVCVFVGDGTQKKEMMGFVKDHALENVTFIGFLNQTEITKIYSITDIFVFPSDFEPFGLVLNEVMCFGVPVVVSSEVGAGYDLVKDNGFVYPAGDTDQLAQYLDRLVEDEELRNKMGQKSLEVISEWNYEKDVEGIVKALEFVTAQKT